MKVIISVISALLALQHISGDSLREAVEEETPQLISGDPVREKVEEELRQLVSKDPSLEAAEEEAPRLTSGDPLREAEDKKEDKSDEKSHHVVKRRQKARPVMTIPARGVRNSYRGVKQDSRKKQENCPMKWLRRKYLSEEFKCLNGLRYGCSGASCWRDCNQDEEGCSKEGWCGVNHGSCASNRDCEDATLRKCDGANCPWKWKQKKCLNGHRYGCSKSPYGCWRSCDQKEKGCSKEGWCKVYLGNCVDRGDSGCENATQAECEHCPTKWKDKPCINGYSFGCYGVSCWRSCKKGEEGCSQEGWCGVNLGICVSSGDWGCKDAVYKKCDVAQCPRNGKKWMKYPCLNGHRYGCLKNGGCWRSCNQDEERCSKIPKDSWCGVSLGNCKKDSDCKNAANAKCDYEVCPKKWKDNECLNGYRYGCDSSCWRSCYPEEEGCNEEGWCNVYLSLCNARSGGKACYGAAYAKCDGAKEDRSYVSSKETLGVELCPKKYMSSWALCDTILGVNFACDVFATWKCWRTCKDEKSRVGYCFVAAGNCVEHRNCHIGANFPCHGECHIE